MANTSNQSDNLVMMVVNRKLLGSHWQTLTFRSFSIMENKPPRALQSRSAATTELDESMAAAPAAFADAFGSEVVVTTSPT